MCPVLSRRRGSKAMPSTDMSRPHQRMVVVNTVSFPGFDLKLYSVKKVKNRETACEWLRIVFGWMKLSLKHQRMFGLYLSGSNVANVDCKYISALVVPCSTRVGVYMPPGVMKAWHSCEHLANGIGQQPGEKSNIVNYSEADSFANSCSRFGVRNWCFTVNRLMGRRSIVKRNIAGPALCTSSDSQAQAKGGLRYALPADTRRATKQTRNSHCSCK